jgi:dihydroorotate dehydrogenase
VYQLIRPLLFMLDAEHSHDLALSTLSTLSRSGPALYLISKFGSARVPSVPCEFAGLALPNPLGLAAGLDKEAAAFPALSALGFGWVELGTVTPLPQPGNPKKRLFRIAADGALINRMGFNSSGLAPFVKNIERLRKNTRSVIGINIGKNAGTQLEHAVDDYTAAMNQVYLHADYIAVNVSSPNTRSLRELQNEEHLGRFTQALKSHRDQLAAAHGKTIPLLLKIAPDLSPDEIVIVAETVDACRLEGVIATNTTIQRPLGHHSTYAEQGGLSGRPLGELATATISTLSRHLKTNVPIVGVGGIESAKDVVEKVAHGAQVVQIYSSFIFNGPGVIRRILLGLEQQMRTMHINDWSTFVNALRS